VCDGERIRTLSNPTGIFRQRALVQVLIGRDLRARYRGTLLGFLWSLVNPLALMAIYVLVFSVYMRMEMDDYPVFLLSGLLAWYGFAGGLGDATGSVLASAGMIKNSSLAPNVFPLVSVGSQMVHFMLSLPLLVALLFLFDRGPTPALAVLPLLIGLQLVLTYGIGLILAASACRFRDILHLVPNVLMVLFFLTPILYPASMIPDRFRVLVDWNPLAYLVQAYQQVLYAGELPGLRSLAIIAGSSLVALAVGSAYFERRRPDLASEI
jgi:lipopolysaccharide transport system permease protein